LLIVSRLVVSSVIINTNFEYGCSGPAQEVRRRAACRPGPTPIAANLALPMFKLLELAHRKP
jgi:hypothetical protein